MNVFNLLMKTLKEEKKGNKGGKSEENAFELTRVHQCHHYSVFAVLAPSHLLRSYRLDVANSRT